MMVGTLTEENEFRFPLTLRNGEQEEIEVRAVLDTGFTGQLVLPRDVISRLALAQEDYEEVSLGDGSVAQFSVHEVTVIWDDEERVVTALGADGDVANRRPTDERQRDAPGGRGRRCCHHRSGHLETSIRPGLSL